MPIIVRPDESPAMKTLTPPREWPYGSERDWLSWKQLIEDSASPLARSLKAEAEKELQRIARCRRQPAKAKPAILPPKIGEEGSGWK